MNVVTIIGVVAAYALVFMAAICLLAEKGLHPFRRLRRKFAKLPFFAKLLVLVFGVTLFVHGSLKSPTNDPERIENGELRIENYEAPPQILNSQFSTLNSNDVERGFVLASISTNSQFSILNSQFPTESQITTNLKWKLRGAHEDWFALPANGWNFPFRDGWMDEPAICAWGEVRPSIGETNALPPLVPFQVSLAPEANWGTGNFPPSNLSTFSPSIFWHAVTPSNSLVATWQNALVERCPTNLVSFQVEFFADGRFEYRRLDDGSQSVVVESYTPVFPFDYDGDGLENSVDPEPYAAGPDAHGTNAEWYNAVCSNVLDAVEGDEPNEPEIAWKDGIKTNAYYFVDVVASRGPAAIRFNGNVTNNLGNPAVVALTAATNHVPLLMGVDYAVTATADYEIILPAGGFAEISTNNEGIVHVKWPVNFHAMQNGGSSYYVDVSPVDPGGEFVWDGAAPMRGGMRSSSSCLSAAFGPYVSFDCGDNCGCGGCYATGTYRYEGMVFSIPLIPCGCSSDDPPGYGIEPTEGPVSNAPPSVTASKRAVIFEDRYENSPGVWVDKHSTTVTITVSADGGMDGGTLTVATENMDKLNMISGQSLPFSSVSVPAGYTMSWTGEYEASSASDSVDDIEIIASFTSNGLNVQPLMDSVGLTSVKVLIHPVWDAPANSCSNRHIIGVCEQVALFTKPSSVSAVWHCSRGEYGFETALDGSKKYVAPTTTTSSDDLKGVFQGTEYIPRINVLEPSGFVVQNVEYVDHCLPTGKVGGADMRLGLYVYPLNVSFVGICLVEIPCYTGAHTGFYTRPDQESGWYHTTAQGAGNWHRVRADGYWATDQVANLGLPDDWSAGVKIWDIPIGWNSEPQSPVVKELNPGLYKQRFEIFDNGTLRIDKHGNWVSRTIDDHIYLNGVQKK